jgi:hypothetical protein
MMKKHALWVTALLVAASLSPAAAFAKSDNAGGSGGTSGNSAIARAAQGTDPASVSEDQGEGQSHGKGSSGTEAGGPAATVTSDTYGSEHGHNGYRGLLNALDNVQDKPAGAVLANILLTQYDTKLTDDQKAQLNDIAAKDEALAKAADLLDKQGSVTDAVYLQREAIKANVKNIELYKQLGKLYEETGRTGVKLYVNGDEPAAEVAPFIRDGNTLVPFRAISEALKANVTWNPDDRSVEVTRGDVTVKLVIDSDTAYVNGNPVKLEVPATIENGSTVVPVRFVSEALQATVKWEGDTQSVVIYQE